MSFTAAKSNPSQRSSLGIGRKLVCSPAPVRRADPGPAPASTVALALRWLREAQTRLDRMKGVRGKTEVRQTYESLQGVLGGQDEVGRRADGSRPRDRSAA